jgi:hypothetical protein
MGPTLQKECLTVNKAAIETGREKKRKGHVFIPRFVAFFLRSNKRVNFLFLFSTFYWLMLPK